MRKLPYRTRTTWLTDQQLILLDVMFDFSVRFRNLRDGDFREQWNVGYSHGLTDDELRCQLRWLCEHGVLETYLADDGTRYRMTPSGLELWSKERSPVWSRYCRSSQKTTLRGRTLLSVTAASSRVRDDFLAWMVRYPARYRTITINDFGLIRWHSFDRLYVGLATYDEVREWTPEEYAVLVEEHRQWQSEMHLRRNWWRTVGELQRFVPGQE